MKSLGERAHHGVWGHSSVHREHRGQVESLNIVHVHHPAGAQWLRGLAVGLPVGAGIAVGLATIAPFLIVADPPLALWGVFDYLLFAPACHQQAERCLWVAGGPMALCARCAAMYAGFAVAGMFALRVGPSSGHTLRTRLFLAALALLAFDVTSEAVGLRDVFLPTRLFTGGLVGATGAWLVLPMLMSAPFAQREEGARLR